MKRLLVFFTLLTVTVFGAYASIPTLSTLYNLTVNPENGSTVKSISSFTVTFNDYSAVNSTSYTYIYSDTVYSTTVTYCKPSTNGNTLTLTANEEVTEAGTYYIVIKSGKVNLDNSTSTSEDIVVTYTVDPNIEEEDTGDDDGDTTVEYTIKMVTPEEGSALASFEAGYTLQFEIEPAENIGYAFFKAGTTAGAGDIVSRTSLKYNSSTQYWEGEVYYEVVLEIGDVYITAAAYSTESDFNYGKNALVTDTFAITGTSEPYEYSSAILESVNPANNSTISNKEDFSFTLTFTGEVNISSDNSFVNYGQGVTYPFTSITSSNGEDYSDIWTLTVSTSIMALFGEGMDLSIVATDESGARVYDEALSEGADYYTYLHLYYEFSGVGLTDFTISPAEGTVESLSTFTLAYDGATYIAPTWNHFPTLYDADDNVVETITSRNTSYSTNEVVFALASEVTTAGTYKLVIPKKTVNVNDELTSFNAELTYTYTIGSSTTEDGDGDDTGDDTGNDSDDDDDSTGINGIAADSDGNFTVYSISGIRVMMTDNAADLKSLPTGLYIVNGKKTAVK